MKIAINTRSCIAALALGIGALCQCGSVAFGDDNSSLQLFKTFANGSYISGEGGAYSFTGSVGASLGSDILYMRRGQEPSGNTVSQIENAINGTQDSDTANNAQNVLLNNRTFSVTPYYATFSGRTDYSKEITPNIYDGSRFNMKRTGFRGRVQSIASPEFTGGLMIGYAKVGMTQSVEIMPDDPYAIADYTGSAKLSLVDFQFGGDLKYRFTNGVFLIASAVGGAEDYRWNRRMFQSYVNGEDSLEGLYSFGTTGNTLVGSLKLAKNYELGSGWSLTPSATVESANSWLFKGTETGKELNGSGPATDAWKAWRMTETLQYSRVVARVGSDLSYGDENMGFFVGAYYGTQIGGESAATVKVTDADNFSDDGISEVRGDGFGRDTMDCHTGLWTYLNQAKTSRIAGLYSVRMYSKATSQVVGGTYSLNF